MLKELMPLINETGLVTLMLMPSETDGHVNVVITPRMPKGGIPELYEPIHFAGEVGEVEASIDMKIKGFVEERGEIVKDLNSSLEAMREAAKAKKEAEASKNKKPTAKVEPKKAEDKGDGKTESKKDEKPAMSLFDSFNDGAGNASSNNEGGGDEDGDEGGDENGSLPASGVAQSLVEEGGE